MPDNEQIVRVRAWSRLDPAELAGYVTDDGCCHDLNNFMQAMKG